MGRTLLFLSLVHVWTHVVTMKECETKNISCTKIRNKEGQFDFRFETPVATEQIEINHNGTPLVRGSFGNMNLSSDVMHCDHNSILMRRCMKFDVKFIQEKQGGKISESCLIFNIIEDLEAVYSSPDWKTIVVGVVTLLLILTAACIAIRFCLRSHKRKGCGFPACVFDRTKTSDTQGQREGGERAEVDNRLNSEREQAEHLLNGRSDSTQSNGDNMDVSLNMDGIITTNDDKGAPQVNGALSHDEGQNGNKGHDPGGGKANTGPHSTENCPNGGTLGEQSSDHDKGQGKDKEQHLLHSQGSAEAGFDETAGGGGQELVHSRGPGSDNTTPSQNEDKEVTQKHN